MIWLSWIYHNSHKAGSTENLQTCCFFCFFFCFCFCFCFFNQNVSISSVSSFHVHYCYYLVTMSILKLATCGLLMFMKCDKNLGNKLFNKLVKSKWANQSQRIMLENHRAAYHSEIVFDSSTVTNCLAEFSGTTKNRPVHQESRQSRGTNIFFREQENE